MSTSGRWDRLAADLAAAGIEASVYSRPYSEGRHGRIEHGVSYGIVLAHPAGGTVEVHDKWWRKNDSVWVGWQVHREGADAIEIEHSPLTKNRRDVVTYVRRMLAGQPAPARPPRVNQFAGRCFTCGATVPAGEGTWTGSHGCEHKPGRCNTKTKTYAASAASQRMAAFHADSEAIYTAGGYARWHSQRIEAPSVVSGHGLRALVGGDKPGDVMGWGIRVYRVLTPEGGGLSDMIAEYPVPRIETGDWYADRLAEDQAIVDLLDEIAFEGVPA